MLNSVAQSKQGHEKRNVPFRLGFIFSSPWRCVMHFFLVLGHYRDMPVMQTDDQMEISSFIL
jgi:hypothetical protein